MSFSSRAKEEMTVKLPKQKCCEKARIFGILLFSGGFTRSGISVTTEIPETIELVRRFFSETFGDEGKTETVASKSGKALRFSVNDNNTVEAAFAYFGIGEDDMMDDIFSLSAENAVCSSLLCTDCERSFIAGAFISCGFVYPPEKKYQAEFVMRDRELTNILAGLLCRRELAPKKVERREKCVLYLQGVQKVSDLLGMCGATTCYFDVLNAQAFHITAEAANRSTNFEVANLRKTALTAGKHINIINEIIALGRFDELSPELRKTAKLRVENPYLTLAELAGMEVPPISKSQESKRLSKISDFLEAIKNK